MQRTKGYRFLCRNPIQKNENRPYILALPAIYPDALPIPTRRRLPEKNRNRKPPRNKHPEKEPALYVCKKQNSNTTGKRSFRCTGARRHQRTTAHVQEDQRWHRL